ncbi:MAG: hypothetical protein ABEH38_04220 [Flavobacteriales bacterium]
MKRSQTRSRFLLLVLLGAFLGAGSVGCSKKEGCTDPNATNYDPEAEKNDGSCKYPDDNNNNGDNKVTVSDHTGTTTWSSDSVYILQDLVFVESGDVLTIEPGTVIKGEPGQGSEASALIVARGGKIMAEGTPNNPIIFTAKNDPLDGSYPIDIRGEWGGVLILGSAELNSTPNTTQVEGIPTSEPRGEYGGTNNQHDAGVFKYVSIRHGGTDIGSGNEINGLTLAGVGSQTEVHHVEVISNKDDGVEYFGGTAQTHHILTAFVGDDSYDYDEGWRGKGQFWVTIQDPTTGTGDRGGEHDGGTNPETGQPYGTPTIYNATYIGEGVNGGTRTLLFRDNGGGTYHNSIFANFSKGVQIENDASASETSFDRFNANGLALKENIFYEVVASGTGASAADLFGVNGPSLDTDGNSTNDETDFENSFTANNNQVADPGIAYSFSLGSPNGGIDPVPSNGGVVSGAPAPSGSFFQNVTYRGAFDPNGANWAKNWTLVDKRGYFN